MPNGQVGEVPVKSAWTPWSVTSSVTTSVTVSL